MKKLIIKFFGILCLTSLFISCNNESEWIYLFDGKTTDGWRGYNSQIMPPGWNVNV